MKTSKQRWQLYILKCGDGSLYTGIALDALQRLKQHECGKGAKYTRSRLPLKLVYMEECQNKSAALKRELYIKSLSRAAKLRLINSLK
jgi:predicted GIY-YIG superfamily endonuclease